MRTVGFVRLVIAAAMEGALAQNQPIQSPQAAACWDEARNRVFGASIPQGLTLYNLGARLHHDCMRRVGAAEPSPRVMHRSAS